MSIEISETAGRKIRTLMSKQGITDGGLRVGVKGGGCSGLCPGCGDGEACLVADDCTSGVCADSICQIPKCNDGVKNGAETDLDCGGPCAVHCGPDQGCNEDPGLHRRQSAQRHPPGG